MYKKIALAIAFSPRMEALICEAKRLKELYGASLILIHIGQDTEEKRKSLDALLHKHQIDLQTTTVIWKEGKPAKKILQVCKQENVDLLVAGALKKENVFTYYLGSVARKIIRKASCSVLVLIEPSIAPKRFDKVVINGTQQSQTPEVIRKGIALCKAEGSTQVFIVNEIKMYLLRMATASEESEAKAAMIKRQLVQDEVSYVENILKDVDQGDLKVNIKVTGGRWAVELAKFAEKIHADLLIVGGQENLNFFDRIFPHDLEDILSNLPCNVLIINNRI
ncbi:MAG TPA: universal stress protein [Cyclobacteriaceae bacterium]|nr:universal stress protein [Cyclobacteriaceae bacterium]